MELTALGTYHAGAVPGPTSICTGPGRYLEPLWSNLSSSSLQGLLLKCIACEWQDQWEIFWKRASMSLPASLVNLDAVGKPKGPGTEPTCLRSAHVAQRWGRRLLAQPQGCMLPQQLQEATKPHSNLSCCKGPWNHPNHSSHSLDARSKSEALVRKAKKRQHPQQSPIRKKTQAQLLPAALIPQEAVINPRIWLVM